MYSCPGARRRRSSSRRRRWRGAGTPRPSPGRRCPPRSSRPPRARRCRCGVFFSRSSTRARARSPALRPEVQGRRGPAVRAGGVERERLLERRAGAGPVAFAQREQAGLRWTAPACGAPRRGSRVTAVARSRSPRASRPRARMSLASRLPARAGGLLGELRRRRELAALQLDQASRTWAAAARGFSRSTSLNDAARRVEVPLRLLDRAEQEMGVGVPRLQLHRLLRLGESLVDPAVGEQEPSAYHAGLGVGGLLRDHLVNGPVGVGRLARRRRGRRPTSTSPPPRPRRRAQLLQHGEGVAVAPHSHVVVGQRELRRRSPLASATFFR